MKKQFNVLMGFLLVTLGGVPLAYAGCMDDAGDAVAAFFTGGASYAVCSTVETVQSLIRTVQTIIGSMERTTNESINTAQQVVNNTASSIETNTNNAMRHFQEMVTDANRMASAADRDTQPQNKLTSLSPTSKLATQQPIKLAAAPTTTAAPAPQLKLKPGVQPSASAQMQHSAMPQAQASMASQAPAASAQDIRNTMHQAADTLSRMHNTLSSTAVNQILGAAQQARNLAERHINAARRIAETSVMAPLHQLEQMLNDLVRHPERIFDPSAMVNESVERMTRAMTEVTEQIHHEIMNEALATVGDIDRQLRQLSGDSAKAEQIHDSMAKLQQRHDQQSLNELRRLLGGGGGSSIAAGKIKILPNLLVMKQTAAQQSSRSMKTFIDALNRDNNKLRSTKLMVAQGRLPTNIEQQAKAELNRMLQGKSTTESTAIKNRLKTQISNDVRNNPKALAELNQHFDERFTVALRLSPMATPTTANPAVKLKPTVSPMKISPVPAAPVK